MSSFFFFPFLKIKLQDLRQLFYSIFRYLFFPFLDLDQDFYGINFSCYSSHIPFYNFSQNSRFRIVEFLHFYILLEFTQLTLLSPFFLPFFYEILPSSSFLDPSSKSSSFVKLLKKERTTKPHKRRASRNHNFSNR